MGWTIQKYDLRKINFVFLNYSYCPSKKWVYNLTCNILDSNRDVRCLFVTALHHYLQTNPYKEPSYSSLAVLHFHLNYNLIARCVNRSDVRSHDELPKIADRWSYLSLTFRPFALSSLKS